MTEKQLQWKELPANKLEWYAGTSRWMLWQNFNRNTWGTSAKTPSRLVADVAVIGAGTFGATVFDVGTGQVGPLVQRQFKRLPSAKKWCEGEVKMRMIEEKLLRTS